MTKAEDQKLIFSNLLNGNPVLAVARVYRKSTKEIDDDFQFVSQKIQSYCFERRMPYIACDTIARARQNRMVLLDILGKVNLDILPIYKKITVNEVCHADDLRS